MTHNRYQNNLQTHLPFSWLLSLATVVGCYLFLNWTSSSDSPIISFFLEDVLHHIDPKLAIIITMGYYFSCEMIIVYYLSVLFEWGGLIAKDGITLLRRAFVRMLHAALAFSACYYRLLRSNGTISREIKLLPVEFMVAITLYLVGIAVTPFARKDLQIVGQIMVIVLIALVLLETAFTGIIQQILHL